MSLMYRACPDCRDDRPFEPYHGAPGTCPDSPDGECPEWACVDCGAALFTGPLPGRHQAERVRDVSIKVA
jgi:hypothetical protein